MGSIYSSLPIYDETPIFWWDKNNRKGFQIIAVYLCVCYDCGFSQHLDAKNIACRKINTIAPPYNLIKYSLVQEGKVYMLPALKYNLNDV